MATDMQTSEKPKSDFNMLSSESKQRLHDKIQQPPGSWLARKLQTMWYAFYGMALTVILLKPIRELLAKNKRYDAGSEASMMKH